MNEKAQELQQFMSDLSEEAYCAGWMDGLEFALWNAVLNGPREYGYLQITPEHISQLKRLAHESGGWIYFDNKSGETFISMEDWQEMFDQQVPSKKEE
jgi:hypothetical protein